MPRLLLLAPSAGFGGGIERVAEAAASTWQGLVTRVDLYRPAEVAVAEGDPVAKLRFVRRAVAAACRLRPDVVMVVHLNLLPVALVAAVFSRARVVAICHGAEAWGRCPSWRRMIMRHTRLVAVSEFTASWVAHRAGLDVRDIKVVLLGIDRRLADASRSSSPTIERSAAQAPCLLTVSRFAPDHRYKGAFDVAEALPLVLTQRPDVRWVVVGEGADLPALRAHCERLGIGHAVEFRGRVDDGALIEAYRHADVFVLPSRADPEAVPPIGEGFGLVFAEAAAFGVPSVASSAGGGSAEFVINELTGLTVPPNSREALAGVIVRLVDDPALRARLGRAARERAESRHQMTHFSEALRHACD